MPLRGIAVLVVEDDRDHRDLARDMLTALGARVTVAVNGEDGVKRLIADGCPDLVLCDLRMPVMDGWSSRARFALILRVVRSVLSPSRRSGTPSHTRERGAPGTMPTLKSH